MISYIFVIKKNVYIHVSDFECLWNYDHWTLGIEGKDYWRGMEYNSKHIT